MDTFFRSNPGMSSRIAHHIEFPDYTRDELLAIALRMAGQMNYRFDEAGVAALREYIALRVRQPHFANARSMRNALDRARLRHANRVFDASLRAGVQLRAEDLSRLDEADVRASRVFRGGLDAPPGQSDPAGTDPAGIGAAGIEAAGTEAAGTEAAGIEAAGTEAADTEAAGTEAARAG